MYFVESQIQRIGKIWVSNLYVEIFEPSEWSWVFVKVFVFSSNLNNITLLNYFNLYYIVSIQWILFTCNMLEIKNKVCLSELSCGKECVLKEKKKNQNTFWIQIDDKSAHVEFARIGMFKSRSILCFTHWKCLGSKIFIDCLETNFFFNIFWPIFPIYSNHFFT